MNTDEIYDAVKKNYLYSEKWQHNFRGEYVVIKEDLRMMFKEIYSLNVTVHLYGSRVVGLANEDSDLNIYIDTSEDKLFSLCCMYDIFFIT